jgi:ubiquinone/menaquinone biosynthesis C-methylase UbiE
MESIHDKKRKSFGAVSEKYQRVRPNYPQKAIDDILKLSAIKKSGKILELGCGSGKATWPFAQKVYAIDALDISQSLVDIAKKKTKKFKNVKYIINSFEKTKLAKENYDLVISAQAFHWLDKKTRVKKIWQTLKKNGHLCIMANSRWKDYSVFYRELGQLYDRFHPNFTKSVVLPSNFEKEIKKSGLFRKPQEKKYFRTIQYSKKDFIDLQASFSWIAILPKKESAEFFSALKKIIENKKEIPYPVETTVLITQKKSSLL